MKLILFVVAILLIAYMYAVASGRPHLLFALNNAIWTKRKGFSWNLTWKVLLSSGTGPETYIGDEIAQQRSREEFERSLREMV